MLNKGECNGFSILFAIKMFTKLFFVISSIVLLQALVVPEDLIAPNITTGTIRTTTKESLVSTTPIISTTTDEAILSTNKNTKLMRKIPGRSKKAKGR